MLQAFGLISYDDQAGVYRMRAFNDGRWLEAKFYSTTPGRDFIGDLRSVRLRQLQLLASTKMAIGQSFTKS
jgi:hypothetical protein